MISIGCKIVLIIALIFSLAQSGLSQFKWEPPVFDDKELGHARQLIDRGQNEQAIDFLMALYENRKHTNHQRTVDLLVQAMQNAKRYELLEEFVQEYRTDFPDSSRGYLIQARSHFLNNQDQKGKEVLYRAIKDLPETPAKYNDVAGEFMRNGILQEAIDVYLNGRQNLQRPFEFTMELSNIYEALGRYGDAATEYLLLGINTPSGSATANARIKALIESTGQADEIVNALEKSAMKYPESGEKLLILANTYSLAGNHRKALNTYIEYDKGTERKGWSMMPFLADCIQDRQYDLAIEGAQYIVTTYGKSSQFYWKCRSVIAGANENKGEIEKAKTGYQEIIKDCPEITIKTDSYMRLGEIAFKNHQFPEAVDNFNQIVTLFPQSLPAISAQMRLGDIRLYHSDFEGAINAYANIKYSERLEIEGDVVYKMAQVEFYRGSYDAAALKGMRYIFDFPSGRYANDCLILIDLINQAKTDSLSLLRFAEADFKRDIGDYQAAKSTFGALIDSSGNQTLRQAAYLKIIKITISVDDYKRAAEMMLSFDTKFPGSYYTPYVLLDLADLYKNNLGEKDKAMSIYRDILEKYPNALIIDRAREGLKNTSGNI